MFNARLEGISIGNRCYSNTTYHRRKCGNLEDQVKLSKGRFVIP